MSVSPAATDAAVSDKPSVDYLVGGFRISIGASSNTPGPRSHIEGFTTALKRLGYPTRTVLASNFPGMARFAGIREGSYKNSSPAKVWIADFVRVAASLWSGANVFATSAKSKQPDIIYERLAVFQTLTSFHRHKKNVFRVIEANGILSRETAKDRQALKIEWYARWLEKRVLRRADLVVAVSENLRSELVQFAKLNPNKILVIPNGIDTSICRIPRTASPRRTVGFVGAIVEWQHLDRLIKTIFEINQNALTADEEIDLEIIGEGPELESLQQLASSLRMENRVNFHGRLSHTDAISSMTGWDVGFAGHEKSSSSSMYHSPLKVYEYAALGVSILCTKSADATMLQSTGSMVYFVDEEAMTLEKALIEALSVRKKMIPETITEMRNSVEQHHGWEQRVHLFMDRVHSMTNIGPKSERVDAVV